ncbi:MAG: ribonuclease P protein component [Alphaproteobacteria bacterium]
MGCATAVSPMAKSAGMRTERLTKRPQFLHVAKGAKAAMPGFILQARPRSQPRDAPIETGSVPCRIGFTATKKIGNAVARNRARRRLRAAADAMLPLHGRPGFDYVLVGRAMTQDRAFDALCDDLQKALDRVHREQKTVNIN